MDITIFSLVSAFFLFASISVTIKLIAVIIHDDQDLFGTGLFMTALCWTMTALFAGWLN